MTDAQQDTRAEGAKLRVPTVLGDVDVRNPLPIRADLVIWGAIQDPPLYTMRAIAAKLKVRADELSDLFGPKPRRSYAKLRKTIEEATS